MSFFVSRPITGAMRLCLALGEGCVSENGLPSGELT
jgi:hypothetical protein